jgi:phosphoribosylformylglycinamidine cyclo-ligase
MGEELHAFSHITGGGIAENTARVIPKGLRAIYDRSTWSLPFEMEFLARQGGVPQADMERTWNCGIGMVAIVAPQAASRTISSLAARGMKAWECGKVISHAQTEAGIGAALEGTYKNR